MAGMCSPWCAGYLCTYVSACLQPQECAFMPMEMGGTVKETEIPPPPGGLACTVTPPLCPTSITPSLGTVPLYR